MRISGLYVYPIKGLGAVSLQSARVTARGLEYAGIGDRLWLLIDQNNKFITQREEPSLAALKCTVTDGAVTVKAPNGQSITLKPGDATDEAVTVTIWKDSVNARLMPQAAHDFFSTYLNKPVRLVHIADGIRTRDDAPRVGQSFADGHPMLTVNSASLADLNKRLAKPVGMDRFRPNIVVETQNAWAEDTWKILQAGETRLEMAKPCPRCVVTTIDQDSGIKDGADPLQTLVKFRFSREFQGALFGQDTVALTQGALTVGDTVRVLETQTAPEFMVRAS